MAWTGIVTSAIHPTLPLWPAGTIAKKQSHVRLLARKVIRKMGLTLCMTGMTSSTRRFESLQAKHGLPWESMFLGRVQESSARLKMLVELRGEGLPDGGISTAGDSGPSHISACADWRRPSSHPLPSRPHAGLPDLVRASAAG